MSSSTAQALLSPAHWLIVALTVVVVMVCVLIHHRWLRGFNHLIARFEVRDRRRVLVLIMGTLLAHVVEIWVFGAGFWLAAQVPDLGSLQGPIGASLLDHVYFSAATYTTVGYGDVYPLGPLRFLAGCEALTGFVLITWSASFTYLEMRRDW